jgi:exonuclease VII large subunit
MQNYNIDFELEELRDTLVAKLLAMVIKNRENQSCINKFIDEKMREQDETIKELKNKNQQLESVVYNLQEQIHQLMEDKNKERIDKVEKDLTNAKEVIYQIIGGIFNSKTQQNNRDLHTEILYSTDMNIDLEQLKRENMWPTTRQGDENQERIQRIEEKLNYLLQVKKGKKIRNLYSK